METKNYQKEALEKATVISGLITVLAIATDHPLVSAIGGAVTMALYLDSK